MLPKFYQKIIHIKVSYKKLIPNNTKVAFAFQLKTSSSLFLFLALSSSQLTYITDIVLLDKNMEKIKNERNKKKMHAKRNSDP